MGLDNAGKTTIVKRMNGENIHEVPPTLGFNISTFDFQGFKLNIWDIGGQKSLRSYWRNYFEETDALVWVVDSADRPRLDDCKLQLQLLLQEERLAGASLLIFANKQDIPNALTCQEITEALELASIQTHHWYIVPCSAFIGDSNIDSEIQLYRNILHGMNWVTFDVASRIFIAT